MKKNITILMFAVLLSGLFLTSGCIGGETEAKGSTIGISMTFYPDMPPDEIPEESSFDIGIKLENKGETTVPKNNITVYIGGISQIGFDLDNTSLKNSNGELQGVQKYGDEEIQGGQDLITFHANRTPNYPGDQEIPITAKICYPYKTLVQGTACLRSSFMKQATGSELCEITGDLASITNNGAPIHVSGASQFPSGSGSDISGLRFNLEFENKGAGVPYLVNKDCTRLMPADVGKVNITHMYLISDPSKEATCSGTSEVMMGSGEGSKSCVLDLGKITSEYEDTLIVELEYGYTEDVTKEVKILNIG